MFNWLTELFSNGDSIAHIVMLYAIIISFGVLLGKIKIGGVSLGVTFVLFVGIIAGHILHLQGIIENTMVLNFVQDFGLILFVYSIGLQVGPSFFTSFKQGGIKMNAIALGVVVLNIAVMLTLYYCFCDRSDPHSLPMMVGVLCGAVTNTPGLGAANAALEQIGAENLGGSIPNIANGYACAYPLGVIGIIGSIILIRYIFKINFKKEREDFESSNSNQAAMKPHLMHLEVCNQALNGKSILKIRHYLGREFVISRRLHEGHVTLPNKDTLLYVGDQLFVVCAEEDADAITAFIGKTIEVNWEEQDVPMASKEVIVSKDKINGKTLGNLHPRSMYGVNVTRLYRSGIELFAHQNVTLQVGDKLVVVGPEDAVERFSNKLGNHKERLDKPNLLTIFVGIFLGIIFGSLPFSIPGMSMPVKLGLAGGPLIVAILMGSFGFKLKLVAYTTNSASLMIRDIGLVLFLASVGVKAGGNFVDTVMNGGLMYVLYGFIITTLPLIIMGIVARLYYKENYFLLMGLLAGASTDPPALAYSTMAAGNDVPSVGYSTVYPLSMFLRIVTAQIIILLLCS
ncbi:MAG: putative transporter [Bacteroidaceae bacterium]|mgnify:FL=1|nr:putative transporter [Bacteroidaceae bacterium]